MINLKKKEIVDVMQRVKCVSVKRVFLTIFMTLTGISVDDTYDVFSNQ